MYNLDMKKKIVAIICCMLLVLGGGLGIYFGALDKPEASYVDAVPDAPQNPDDNQEIINPVVPEAPSTPEEDNKDNSSTKPNNTMPTPTPEGKVGYINYTRSATSNISGGKRVTLEPDAFKLRTYVIFQFNIVGSNVRIKFNEVELSERLNEFEMTERNGVKTITGRYIVTGAEKNFGSQSYIDVLYTGSQDMFNVKYIYACDNLYAGETAEYDNRFMSYDPSTGIVTASYTNNTSSHAWVNFFVPFTNKFKTNTTYTVVLETWQVQGLRPINFVSPFDGGAGSQLDISSTGITFNANIPVQTRVFKTASDFSKCSYDFRSYTNVPVGGTMDFKFRFSVYEGEVAVNNNLYQASMANYAEQFNYDMSSNVVSINCTNNASSMIWPGFRMPFTNTFKTNTAYTAVLEVFDLVSGNEVKLASPHEGGSNQDIAQESIAFYINTKGNSIHFITFTTASDFSECIFDFRSYVPVGAKQTVNLRFRLSVYEGTI